MLRQYIRTYKTADELREEHADVFLNYILLYFPQPQYSENDISHSFNALHFEVRFFVAFNKAKAPPPLIRVCCEFSNLNRRNNYE